MNGKFVIISSDAAHGLAPDDAVRAATSNNAAHAATSSGTARAAEAPSDATHAATSSGAVRGATPNEVAYIAPTSGDARVATPSDTVRAAETPSAAMLAAAACRLKCAPEDVRFSAVDQVPGAFFFSVGPVFGAPRVLIDAAGEQLWRPSAYSPARHIRDWFAGARN